MGSKHWKCGRRVARAYFKGIDQPLLRDGVKTFGTSAVIAKPYVMTAADGLHVEEAQNAEPHSQFRSGCSVPLNEYFALARVGGRKVTGVGVIARMIGVRPRGRRCVTSSPGYGRYGGGDDGR
jgi:hypothetical protein